ncbi:MAG TPA: hypothetical protein ENK88_09065 [Campylobacterales bacterium]|nr:hypothetical protein [Campylobacterales bacterium]
MALMEFDPDILKSVCPELCSYTPCDLSGLGFLEAEIAALCASSCVPLECEPLPTTEGGSTDGGGGTGNGGNNGEGPPCTEQPDYTVGSYQVLNFDTNVGTFEIIPESVAFQVRFRIVAVGALGQYYSALYIVEASQANPIYVDIKELNTIVSPDNTTISLDILFYNFDGSKFQSCEDIPLNYNFEFSPVELELERVEV